MATDTEQPTNSHRFWPSGSGLILVATLGIVGTGGLVVTLGSGEWFAALIFAAILAYVVFSFGWIDLEAGRLTQDKLIGGRVVETHEVQSMKVDFVRSKSTKWYFPVLVLHDGEEVRLASLKTVSENKATRFSQMIQAVMNGEVALPGNEPSPAMAGQTMAGQAPAPHQPESTGLFTPLPGLEQHYNK